MGLIITLVNAIFTVFILAVVIRCLMSWLPLMNVNIDPYNPLVRLVWQVSDIVLEPFRRIIPPVGAMDISPIVALLVLQVVQGIVNNILYAMAR